MEHKRGSTLPAKARQDDLVVQELPDELLVYDLKNHNAHCLNETAAFVWNHCDGATTVGEMVKLMEEKWRQPVQEELVWFALSNLSRADLLRAPIVLPETKSRFSRRSSIKQLLGALVAIPVIMSITAPTAMAGASLPLVCQTCVKALNTNNCPAECNTTIFGSCFQNNGCGGGQLAGSFTCLQCKATGLSPLSWIAP